jgi:hypothetical protein
MLDSRVTVERLDDYSSRGRTPATWGQLHFFNLITQTYIMKKYSIAVILFIIFLQAEAKKIQGKIVLNNNETINVTFVIPFGFLSSEPSYLKLQTGVKYVNASNKKIMVRPDDAKEISFSVNGQDIRMLAVDDDLELQSIFSSQEKVFLKLEIDGAVKLFTSYTTQSSPGMYNGATGSMSPGTTYNIEKFVLKKGNGRLTRPRGITFRKDMSEFFSDCPELVERIQGRVLKKGDLEIMVREYNKKCSND